MSDPDDAQVVYTVRELLDQLRTEQAKGFTRLEASMDGKADKADVARMEARLDAHAQGLQEHGRQLNELQTWRRDREVAATVHSKRDERIANWKQRAWGVAGTLAMCAATLGAALIASGGHL